MSRAYGKSEDAGMAEAFHVQDSLAMHKLKQTLNDNDSGVCEECDLEIPAARLQVVPNARYCVFCQSVHDKNPLKFTWRNHYVP